jgi:hypothetical protein
LKLFFAAALKDLFRLADYMRCKVFSKPFFRLWRNFYFGAISKDTSSPYGEIFISGRSQKIFLRLVAKFLFRGDLKRYFFALWRNFYFGAVSKDASSPSAKYFIS